MHNIHLIGVVAEDGNEAVSRALYLIEDWGTEDNWRVACGAVASNGVTYSTGAGRWEPAGGFGSPATVSAEVREDIAAKLAVEIKTDGVTEIDDYIAAANLRARSAAKSAVRQAGSVEAFDAFTHNYRPYEYDEFGVTHFDDEIEGTRWLVLVDMHS